MNLRCHFLCMMHQNTARDITEKIQRCNQQIYFMTILTVIFTNTSLSYSWKSNLTSNVSEKNQQAFHHIHSSTTLCYNVVNCHKITMLWFAHCVDLLVCCSTCRIITVNLKKIHSNFLDIRMYTFNKGNLFHTIYICIIQII